MRARTHAEEAAARARVLSREREQRGAYCIGPLGASSRGSGVFFKLFLLFCVPSHPPCRRRTHPEEEPVRRSSGALARLLPECRFNAAAKMVKLATAADRKSRGNSNHDRGARRVSTRRFPLFYSVATPAPHFGKNFHSGVFATGCKLAPPLLTQISKIYSAVASS